MLEPVQCPIRGGNKNVYFGNKKVYSEGTKMYTLGTKMYLSLVFKTVHIYSKMANMVYNLE